MGEVDWGSVATVFTPSPTRKLLGSEGRTEGGVTVSWLSLWLKIGTMTRYKLGLAPLQGNVSTLKHISLP